MAILCRDRTGYRSGSISFWFDSDEHDDITKSLEITDPFHEYLPSRITDPRCRSEPLRLRFVVASANGGTNRAGPQSIEVHFDLGRRQRICSSSHNRILTFPAVDELMELRDYRTHVVRRAFIDIQVE